MPTPAALPPCAACSLTLPLVLPTPAGIGLPAVAASGAITANSIVSTGQHLALLEELGL